MEFDTPTAEPAAPGIEARHRSSRLAVFVAAFLPLLTVYVSTARTDLPYHIDAATNVFTAWTIGTTGSPLLHHYAELAEPEHKGVFAWVVPSERGPVSQYPPGTALLAAPLYAIWSEATPVSLSAVNAAPDARVTVPIPRLWPAAVVAAVTTAAALGFVALSVLEAGGSRRAAITTSLIGGLGTGAWTVAGHQLWQHGPNMLWVALGVYLAARQRWGWAGLAFGALAITRPPVVLVGAALGVLLLLQRRFRPALWLLAGVVPGLVALLSYNAWLFGSPSVSGGYGTVFAERAIGGETAFLSNIGSALFSFDHGLFTWSPFVAVGLIGASWTRGRIPAWSIAAAIGGLAYLLLQLRLNRASGGEGFSYYRYPLEALTAGGTILAVGVGSLMGSPARLGRLLVIASSAFALVVHAMVVVS